MSAGIVGREHLIRTLTDYRSILGDNCAKRSAFAQPDILERELDRSMHELWVQVLTFETGVSLDCKWEDERETGVDKKDEELTNVTKN